MLWQGPLKLAVGLSALGVILRVVTVVGTLGTVWMLSGFAWFAVMAFYAMTALWPVLLWSLLRSPGKAATVATCMIPLALLEGVGPLGQLTGMVTSALLGAPRFELQSASAALFAIAQVFFLLKKMRTA